MTAGSDADVRIHDGSGIAEGGEVPSIALLRNAQGRLNVQAATNNPAGVFGRA